MSSLPTPTPDQIRAQASNLAFGKPIIENSFRGFVVEVIVKSALENAGWDLCSADWHGWDFEHRAGYRVEIKQSAARQTWTAPPKPSPPRFDIRERTGFYDGAAWTAHPGRLAQIYIFAFHPITNDNADHRDPAQWQFYVVPAQRLPKSKGISLTRVVALSPSLSWAELRDSVEAARLALPGL